MKYLRQILAGIAIIAIFLSLFFILRPAFVRAELYDIRYLNGYDWNQMNRDEQALFIYGFQLGATSTEELFVTDKWSEQYSLYNWGHKTLIHSLDQLYSDGYQELPIVSALYLIISDGIERAPQTESKEGTMIPRSKI